MIPGKFRSKSFRFRMRSGRTAQVLGLRSWSTATAEEVVTGAHQLPFGVACAQAPSGEPLDPADLLDVAEHRFDRVGSLGVERSPSFGRKLALHDPSALSPEH